MENTNELKGADLRPFFLRLDAEDQSGIKHQQVSRWRYYLVNLDAYRDRLLGSAYKAAALIESEGTNVRGTRGTGDNEWFTPPEYIDRARTVLGDIDLDPASHRAAQERVKAAKFFTKEDDGLSKEWRGRVWLNPPYSQPAIGDFVTKLVREVTDGNVLSAILLTHNYTDTSWFHEAAVCSDVICFTRGRIRFEAPHGEFAAPTQGQAFFYFGDDVSLFTSVFAEVGLVLSKM